MKTRHPSVYTRLLAYFAANPDEELTRADIAAKFNAGAKNVDAALTRARATGLIEAVHAYRVPASKKGAV